MDLFNTSIDATKNHLPYDGEVNYYGKIFNSSDADFFYDELLNNIDWRQDEAYIYGKLIQTKRKVAWYGSQQYAYTYSNITKTALPWTPSLMKLKEIIERLTNSKFNSCLLNLYHDGSEGMAWHSDGEKDLEKHGTIASVSFGAERKFAFKHKISKEKVSLLLEHGSLLLMKGKTQDHWLHRLPPTTIIHKPRINLTFRKINTSK